MAKPISVDLRERVCEAVSEGLSRHRAAARFKVSASARSAGKLGCKLPAAWHRRMSAVTVGPIGSRLKRILFLLKLRRGLTSHWRNYKPS